MQSSYNVIKKDYVNSKTTYTVKAPVLQNVHASEALKDADMALEEESINIEEIKAYAESILNDASQRAEGIINSAAREAEKIKKEAYETAFKKGYAEGVKKGFEDGTQKALAIRENADEVLMEAHRVSREYISRQKNEIINLALAIAEKVIGYESSLGDAVITKTVYDAIDSAVLKEQVVIRVNPVDFAAIDARKDELLQHSGRNMILFIIKDVEIKRGGCRLETESSSVDATIDAQLTKIKEALLG